MSITITATAQSIPQVKSLLAVGVDYLYVGDKNFGLRLAQAFTMEELKEIVAYAHEKKKEVIVAVNALMSVEMMQKILAYLFFLEKIGVNFITVADAGVIYVLERERINLPYIYDSSVFVTSSRQVNFWAKRGAVGAVLARELTENEMELESGNFQIPVEVLVYGPTVIQHSKRKLLSNYFKFTKTEEVTGKDRSWLISDPQDEKTHYSIYEDQHGTHIFANNDLNLMLELNKLSSWGYRNWKLDGLYTPENNFIKIAELFVNARELILGGGWDLSQAILLDEKLRHAHPSNRGLDQGFFALCSEDIR